MFQHNQYIKSSPDVHLRQGIVFTAVIDFGLLWRAAEIACGVFSVRVLSADIEGIFAEGAQFDVDGLLGVRAGAHLIR